MLICDRCESRKSVATWSNISIKVANQAVQLYDKPIDLCDNCANEVKKSISKFLEPLPKQGKG